MAKGGRYAHAVPARAAQQTGMGGTPRAVTSRVVLGVFVAAVMVAVLAIVLGAPQYAGHPTIDAMPGSASPLAAGPGRDGLTALGVLGDSALRVETSGAHDGGAVTGTGDTAPADAQADRSSAPASRPPQKLKGYRWPISRGRLTSYYDYRDSGFLVVDGRRIHEGIDIASFCGAAVRAAHAGTVLAAGRDFARHTGFSGSLDPFYERLRRRTEMNALPIAVVVDDGNGYRSVYAHLESSAVKRGQSVKAGQVIGYEGATGNATGCHLHYELIRMEGPWMRVAAERVRRDLYPRWARERVDPLLVLSLSDPRAPRRVPGIVPPKDPPRASASGGPEG